MFLVPHVILAPWRNSLRRERARWSHFLLQPPPPGFALGVGIKITWEWRLKHVLGHHSRLTEIECAGWDPAMLLVRHCLDPGSSGHSVSLVNRLHLKVSPIRPRPLIQLHVWSITSDSVSAHALTLAWKALPTLLPRSIFPALPSLKDASKWNPWLSWLWN